jgi:hypothetical protein
MKKLIALFFLTFSLIEIYSQPSITWQKIYGNHLANPETFGTDICNDYDSNFYVLGSNNFPPSFNIIKIDPYGDTLWEKTIDTNRNSYGGCTSSFDGGVVCTGDGAFTIKYDKNGNRIWKKSYGFQALCYKITRTFDGNFIICGQYGGWYGLIFKIDLNGNLIWQRSYNLSFYAGWYNYVIETNDYKYIAVGFRARNENDTVTGLITKIDTAGNTIWEKEYNLFNKSVTNLISVDNLNNGYLVCGQQTTDSIGRFVVDFIKIDLLGNLIFSKRLNGENNWNYGSTDIKKINENRYFICNNIFRQDTINTKLFIIDSIGNIIHTKIFNDMDYIKLQRSNIISNGDIIIAGSCDYVNPN